MEMEEADSGGQTAAPAAWWLQYRAPIIAGGGGIVLIIVSVILLFKSVTATTPIEFSTETEGASVSGWQHPQVTVDVEGAVVSPGVYTLPTGSRVEDAIAAAGSLTPEADTERIAATINRAARLVDGGKVYIPKKGDPTGQVLQAQGRALNSPLVGVNTASQAELEALSGIGPATAKKIIDNRPYQMIEELVAKKAMSQSLFNKLKEQLTL